MYDLATRWRAFYLWNDKSMLGGKHKKLVTVNASGAATSKPKTNFSVIL